MSFFATFGRMLEILFAIALGFLAKRRGFLSDDTDRGFTKVILNITLPCMILASVMAGTALPGLDTVLSLLLVSAVFYGVGALGALVFPRLFGGTPQQRGVWRFSLLFPNTAFIGYPVVEALFGEGALFYAVILNLPFNLLTLSIGPLLLGGSRRFSWRSLCTPGIVASLAGLAIALGGIRTPALLGGMADFVGNATVPLSLLMLGSVLAGMPVKNVVTSPRSWAFAAIRLLVMPTALWLALRPLGLDAVVSGVAVIEAAMPAALNGAMLCLEYDGDVQGMAQNIFLTTLVSMITIPLTAALLL